MANMHMDIDLIGTLSEACTPASLKTMLVTVKLLFLTGSFIHYSIWNHGLAVAQLNHIQPFYKPKLTCRLKWWRSDCLRPTSQCSWLLPGLPDQFLRAHSYEEAVTPCCGAGRTSSGRGSGNCSQTEPGLRNSWESRCGEPALGSGWVEGASGSPPGPGAWSREGSLEEGLGWWCRSPGCWSWPCLGEPGWEGEPETYCSATCSSKRTKSASVTSWTQRPSVVEHRMKPRDFSASKGTK